MSHTAPTTVHTESPFHPEINVTGYQVTVPTDDTDSRTGRAVIGEVLVREHRDGRTSIRWTSRHKGSRFSFDTIEDAAEALYRYVLLGERG